MFSITVTSNMRRIRDESGADNTDRDYFSRYCVKTTFLGVHVKRLVIIQTLHWSKFKIDYP
jgi:hypothetical protein